jgi:preprotein translocase subunit SecE
MPSGAEGCLGAQMGEVRMKAVATVANADAGNSGEVVKPSWLERAKEYFEDLKAEMSKVTWPSRQQVQATTAVVIGAVFAFALYFALVDVALSWVVGKIFDSFTK